MRSYNRRRHRRRKGCRLFAIITLVLIMLLLAKCAGTLLDSNLSHGRQSNIDISGEVEKGTFPMFLQYDIRWKDLQYGDGPMEKTGCGPTCLSIVHCGLTGNDKWDPYSVATKADSDGYYVDGSGSAWDMMTYLAEDMGLNAEELNYSENSIIESLQSGKPVICAMRPGDFTTAGHFIVLTGLDDNGEITLRDPNSEWNSKQTWSIDRLMPQIKNLWCYDAGIFN